MTSTPLPKFSRAENPPGIHVQVRDEDILETIFSYGGVVAKRHLKEMFWPGKTQRAMEKRLSKLYHNGYINWPNQEHRRTGPVPETVCWLDWRAAILLGARRGLQVEPIKKDNESQLRKLENSLRKQGFHWMREPRWIQLRHDLSVVDFRLLLENALRSCPSLTLAEWLNEGVFRSQTDVVEYEIEGRDGMMRKGKKGVCPDGYFVLDDEGRKTTGQPYRARFLLELDMATHDNPSFGAEKSLPGAAYINSPLYKKRFGHNSGRWLIVTTAGQRRMENLMRQTEEKLGEKAKLFYFTTFDRLSANNLVTAPVWFQVGLTDPVSLLPKY